MQEVGKNLPRSYKGRQIKQYEEQEKNFAQAKAERSRIFAVKLPENASDKERKEWTAARDKAQNEYVKQKDLREKYNLGLPADYQAKNLTPDELANMHALHELKTMRSLSRNGVDPTSITGEMAMAATRIVSGNIPADDPSQGLIANTDPAIRSLGEDKTFQTFFLENRTAIRTMPFDELQKSYEKALTLPKQPQQPQPLSNEEFTARFNQLQETMASLQKQMAELQKLNPNLKVPEAPQQEAPKAPERPAWVKAKSQNLIQIDPFYPLINAATKGMKNTKKVQPGLEKFMENLKKFNKTYEKFLKDTKEQRKVLGDGLGMSADNFRRELAPMLKEGKQYQSNAIKLGTDLGEAELNNLEVITQLETMDTLAANNIDPSSREGLSVLLASKMAFDTNKQELNKQFEQVKDDPMYTGYFSHIKHMCTPKEMQLDMRSTYREPTFKSLVDSMDEKQLKDLLNKPASELKKAYEAHQKKLADQAVEKAVFAQPTQKTSNPAKSYAIPLTGAHRDMAGIEVNALVSQLPPLKNSTPGMLRGRLLPMALAFSVGKDAIQSMDMSAGDKARVDLRKSLADVMAFKVIQEGVKHGDPDFMKALESSGGMQKMGKIIRENNVFRDMIRVDTPEAAEKLINSSSNDKTLYRLAYNASHLANRPPQPKAVTQSDPPSKGMGMRH